MMRYLIYLLCSFILLFTACDQSPSGTNEGSASTVETASKTSPAPAAAPDDHLRPGYHFTPPSAWTNHHELCIRASAEIFFDEGDPVMIAIFFPEKPFTKLTIEAYGLAGEGMPAGWGLVKGQMWGLE